MSNEEDKKDMNMNEIEADMKYIGEQNPNEVSISEIEKAQSDFFFRLTKAGASELTIEQVQGIFQVWAFSVEYEFLSLQHVCEAFCEHMIGYKRKGRTDGLQYSAGFMENIVRPQTQFTPYQKKSFLQRIRDRI